jgi:hypothetical protein
MRLPISARANVTVSFFKVLRCRERDRECLVLGMCACLLYCVQIAATHFNRRATLHFTPTHTPNSDMSALSRGGTVADALEYADKATRSVFDAYQFCDTYARLLRLDLEQIAGRLFYVRERLRCQSCVLVHDEQLQTIDATLSAITGSLVTPLYEEVVHASFIKNVLESTDGYFQADLMLILCRSLFERIQLCLVTTTTEDDCRARLAEVKQRLQALRGE